MVRQRTLTLITLGLIIGLIPFLAYAQQAINGSRYILGYWDASQARWTKPFYVAATQPATCAVGEVMFDSDATAGQNIYLCTSVDTWTQVTVGGSGDMLKSAYDSNEDGTVSEADHAGTADYATNAGDATTAGTADYATSAGDATTAGTADYATNAGSAAALDADGSNCGTGEYAQGVDAAGNAQGCATPPGGGDMTTAVYDTAVDGTVDSAYSSEYSGYVLEPSGLAAEWKFGACGAAWTLWYDADGDDTVDSPDFRIMKGGLDLDGDCTADTDPLLADILTNSDSGQILFNNTDIGVYGDPSLVWNWSTNILTLDGIDLNADGTADADYNGSSIRLRGTAGASELNWDGTMVDCDNATTSKVLYDVTSGKFSCGTDQTGGAGTQVDIDGDGTREINLSSSTLLVDANEDGTARGNIDEGSGSTVGRIWFKYDGSNYTGLSFYNDGDGVLNISPYISGGNVDLGTSSNQFSALYISNPVYVGSIGAGNYTVYGRTALQSVGDDAYTIEVDKTVTLIADGDNDGTGEGIYFDATGDGKYELQLGVTANTISFDPDSDGTVESTINSAGAFTGSAASLTSDPTDCGANTWATTIAANGNLTCSAVSGGAGITDETIVQADLDWDTTTARTESQCVQIGASASTFKAGSCGGAGTQVDIDGDSTREINLSGGSLLLDPDEDGTNESNFDSNGRFSSSAASIDDDRDGLLAVWSEAPPTGLVYINPDEDGSKWRFSGTALTYANSAGMSLESNGNVRFKPQSSSTAIVDMDGSNDKVIVDTDQNGTANFVIGTDVPSGGEVYTWDGTNSVGIWATAGGTGDMTKAVYDTNLDSTVDSATALAADPSDCSANQFANAIAASGNLSCAALADADIPNTITIDRAASAGLLDSDNDGTAEVSHATTTISLDPDDDGTAEVTFDSNGDFSGKAASATVLATDPSDCGANTWATTIANSGNLTCSAVSGGAGITDGTILEADLTWNSTATRTAGQGLVVASDTTKFDVVTLMTESSTNTLTNKTYDAAGTGNVFTIEDGASVTVSSAGQIKIDTTAGQLVYYGTAQRTLDPRRELSGVMMAPSTADDPFLFKMPYAATFTGFNCIVAAATSVTVDIQECGADGTSCATLLQATVACDTDQQAGTINSGNSTVDAGDWIKLDITAVNGTPGSVSFTAVYTITQE